MSLLYLCIYIYKVQSLTWWEQAPSVVALEPQLGTQLLKDSGMIFQGFPLLKNCADGVFYFKALILGTLIWHRWIWQVKINHSKRDELNSHCFSSYCGLNSRAQRCWHQWLQLAVVWATPRKIWVTWIIIPFVSWSWNMPRKHAKHILRIKNTNLIAFTNQNTRYPHTFLKPRFLRSTWNMMKHGALDPSWSERPWGVPPAMAWGTDTWNHPSAIAIPSQSGCICIRIILWPHWSSFEDPKWLSFRW